MSRPVTNVPQLGATKCIMVLRRALRTRGGKFRTGILYKKEKTHKSNFDHICTYRITIYLSTCQTWSTRRRVS